MPRPTSRKRKNVDEDEGEPKTSATPRSMTKKQAREQAILRAKKAMEGDKKKVKAVQAKQGGREADDFKTEPTPSKRARTSKSTPSTKKSKKQAREEAQLRAKEWAAKDREEMAKKKSPAKQTEPEATTSTTPVASASTAPVASASTTPVASAPVPLAPNGPIPGDPGAMHPAMMAQYMMSQQPQFSPYGQPYTAGGYNPQYVAPYYPAGYAVPPAGAQYPPATAPPAEQTTPAAAQESTPPAPVPSAKVKTAPMEAKQPVQATEEVEDDDDVMPPPPTDDLQKQISQQVMANFSASMKNKPTPYNEPPPEAFTESAKGLAEETEEAVYDDQPIVVDEVPEPQDDSDISQPPSGSTFRNLVGAVFAAVISYLVMNVTISGSTMGSTSRTSTPKKCFVDTTPQYENGELVDWCRYRGTALPCPAGGVCDKGSLVGCWNKYYTLSKPDQACLLRPEAQQHVDALRQILEELSVDEICGSANSYSTESGTDSLPLFVYSELQFANPMELATNTLDHLVLESEFVTELDDESDPIRVFVGLKDDHELEIPLSCKMQGWAKSGMRVLGNLVWEAVQVAARWAWAGFSAYPLSSLIGLVVLWLVQRRRSVQAYRTKLVKDVANVRELAYSRLQEDPSQSHLVLHVRDEIVLDLVSTPEYSKRGEHQYLISDVWPRVVPQFQQDNRVRKSQRVQDGKPRDVWQWMAAPSSKKTKESS